MKRGNPSGAYSSAMVRGHFNGNSRNDGNFSAALVRAAGPMAEATLVCSRALPDKRGSRQSRGRNTVQGQLLFPFNGIYFSLQSKRDLKAVWTV
jgi:hypothetical protein